VRKLQAHQQACGGVSFAASHETNRSAGLLRDPEFQIADQAAQQIRPHDSAGRKFAPGLPDEISPELQCIAMNALVAQTVRAAQGCDKIDFDSSMQLHCCSSGNRCLR
jgi:hypothetical protein